LFYISIYEHIQEQNKQYIQKHQKFVKFYTWTQSGIANNKIYLLQLR